MGSYQGNDNFEDPDNFDRLFEALRAIPWKFDIQEVQGEASAEIDGEAKDGVLEDLTPIKSLEELKTLFVSANEAYQRRKLIEAVMFRTIAALITLTGVGIGVYLVTSNITVLLIILLFFLALLSRFLKLTLIPTPKRLKRI